MGDNEGFQPQGSVTIRKKPLPDGWQETEVEVRPSKKGAVAGAAAGAAIGSAVPVVGTAIGGVVGGLIGLVFGPDD